MTPTNQLPDTVTEEPVLIEVTDDWQAVSTDDLVPLRFILSRPAGQAGPVTIPYINTDGQVSFSLDKEFFQGDIKLEPGESIALIFGLRFHTPGLANLRNLYVQIVPEGCLACIVRFPDRPVRVVPSLGRHKMHAEVQRVCAYSQGVKVEVRIEHRGQTPWEDFEVSVGPDSQGRAGVTYHRRPLFSPKDQDRFEVVLAGDLVELTLAGKADGVRVEDRRQFPIPAADAHSADFLPFTFLEPRDLADARPSLTPTQGGNPLTLRQGVFHVFGGGTRYEVRLRPDIQAKSVTLLRAPGEVEVEPMGTPDGSWAFLLTVVGNAWLTQPVCLYYDISLQNRNLRGELYLAVHPTAGKLWAIAFTAGLALSVKGVVGLASAFLGPESASDDWLTSLGELFHRTWSDWLQLLSIPLIWLGLNLLDRLARPFRGI